MHILKTQNLSFKRALKESEIADYTKTLREARDVLGANGKNVLIVPDTSLPTSDKSIIGNMSDETALEFANFMKTYLGINAIEHLPQGDFHNNSYAYNPYNATSLTYSRHLINLENFTKEEFGGLLTQDEIKSSKNSETKGKTRINFNKVYSENSEFTKTLKLAYSRFNENNSLWKDYQEYRKENDEDIIPRVLFSELAEKYNNYEPSNWKEPDATLFKDVDETKKKRFEELKEEYREQIDFYAFQQFFANKNLKYSKEKLNQKGIDLIGDCPIRFSRDEMWANPEAIRGDLFVGNSNWDIKALDFENLFDKDGKPLPSMQLLEKKFSKLLRDYDGIRIDCGWCYVQPSLYSKNGEKKYINDNKNLLDDKIVKYFEKLAREIKGEDYDLTKIMYEAEVGPYEDFFGFNPDGGVIEPLKDRVQIYTTNYAEENWGTLENFKYRGIEDDELLIGTGNHDSEPINNLSRGEKPLTEQEIKKLNEHYSEYFNYRADFETKDDLIKAKRAEIALAKNQMHLFYDVFGWKLEDDEKYHLVDNYYSTKINKNFKEEYLNSLKNGTGFNPMESIKIAFLKEGHHVHHKELYEKVSKYSEILKAEEDKKLDTKGDPAITKKKGKGKENSPLALFGALAAGVFALGTFIASKFKKKPVKKENV